jgi:glutamate-1-semialdehyde aminotransferase/spore coat polysaccharide biosynthesis protein SpsF (cytidylyltransferase family)
MKTVAVCQARMKSTRLPGKVLQDIAGMTALERVYFAAHEARGVDEVWVATSTEPEDDVIVELCWREEMNVFRGSEVDVISRYRGVAAESQADVLVRLTSDCPFLDASVIADVVALRSRTVSDYASNIDPATWPDGLDCEVFTVEALKIADIETHRPSDRDCVTTYIRNNKYLFQTANLLCPLPGLQKERWVLDSPEDLEFCQQLAARLQCWPATYLEILEVLDFEPRLRKINAKYTRNERYYEGMALEDLGTRSHRQSHLLLQRAKKVIPLGAQTFSKSYIQYPEQAPLFASHGDGGFIYDVDGNDYVDLVGALLPVILGYRDPDVDAAIRNQLDCGISFSLSTELEIILAERLCKLIPCAEMVRFGKNGTDVTTAAVRLARAFTGRECIGMKFSGYHGWGNWSVANTQRSKGVPPEQTMHFADLDFILNPDKLAAIIVEPERSKGLQEIRDFCTKHGIVLIFDEIITGFRYGMGGAGDFFDVKPDLATFGKAMANGMPISAVVGRRDIMKLCEPPDNIFYSGTFFGESLSIAAAIACLDKLEKENVPTKLTRIGADLGDFAQIRILKAGLDNHLSIQGCDPLIRLSFRTEAVKALFIQEMVRMGVLIVNSHNLSYAHGPSEIARVKKAYEHTIGVLAEAVDKNDIEKRIEGHGVGENANVRY